MTDEKLSYKSYLRVFPLAKEEGNANCDYFVSQAQHMHSLSVLGEIQDQFIQSLILADSLNSTEAMSYIKLGLGRRGRALWFSFRELYHIIPPDRDRPLLLDDADRASELLNSIYLNIRGALDNVAWAFVSVLGGVKALGLQDVQVGLFSRKIQQTPELAELSKSLSEFVKWNAEFKKFRDPAAHRIPLSAIPSIQNPSSAEQHAKTYSEWYSIVTEAARAGADRNYSLSEQLYKEADQVWARLQSIGDYKPLFEYESGAQPMPIYPTVPEDIGFLIRIVRRTLPLLFEMNNRR